MNSLRKYIILTFFSFATAQAALSQQTVFTTVQDPEKIADRHVADSEYLEAIELYSSALRKRHADADILLKIARCYIKVKQFENAVDSYAQIRSTKQRIPIADLINFGDALCNVRNYAAAEEIYQEAHEADKTDESISQKIWRLKNLQYLYEDSAHFSVRPVPGLNTDASEMCAVNIDGNLVFVSNRKEMRPIDHVNGNITEPYYKSFNVVLSYDSTVHNFVVTGKADKFAKPLHNKYNFGPIALFSGEARMVYVASSEQVTSDGFRQLGLYFATHDGSKWKHAGAFPYNSDQYSITDVTISEDGTAMIFSSNMKGGYGGKDLYISKFTEGRWSKPSNLGEVINTNRDEAFPYLHRNTTLYFSSDGHPGLGALDLFRATVLHDSFTEPENVGYPLNSHRDDFGITFDSIATHGYLSSNRNGKSDDVYEFDMDLLTYPLEINGILKFKQYAWSDQRDINVGTNAKLTVVDSWRNTIIFETTTGDDGRFRFSVPYFSRYHILVMDDDETTHIASLEIAKYRNDAGSYEIVVVKDLFAQRQEQK
jgi:Tetratricopeptide repeat/WD40-like Beta Propeller Repeat